MKLLIITQKVDRDDPILGFFHRWVMELSKHCQSMTVICLEKGAYNFPATVQVFSLGKEQKQSRLQYLSRFYKYIWQERKNYDAVLSHMNQEYILLAGWLWRLLGKRIYLWRNHYAGDELTDMAAVFCRKIFCTSHYSYTAKFKKTVLMPVGIDTDLFKPEREGQSYSPRSILFLARIAPSKRPDLLIDALKGLGDAGQIFTASIYGDASPSNEGYKRSLEKSVSSYGLDDKVIFREGVPNEQTVSIYQSHQIFVNLSPSGMYDKTIFEAMACGIIVLTSNKNLRGEINERLVYLVPILSNGVSVRISLGNKRNPVFPFKSLSPLSSINFSFNT